MSHFLDKLQFFKTEKTMFIALCLAGFDIQTRELTFTNAGLCEPLLISEGGIFRLKSRSPKYPLGSLRNTAYEERTLPLKPGDVLIFYTDGVPEARNYSKGFYEYERLEKAVKEMDTASLSAREIKDRIIRDVKQFSRSAPQFDDMTVVVVKVK